MGVGFFQIIESSAIRAPWGWALLLMTIVGYFKIWPKLKEITNKREIDLLEKRGEDMREMRARMEKMEAQIAEKDAKHEAEVTLLRHRLNNVTQCLDALVMLLKAAPDKVDAHIKLVEEMRAEQRKEEALEKGAIRGAAIGTAKTKGEKP